MKQFPPQPHEGVMSRTCRFWIAVCLPAAIACSAADSPAGPMGGSGGAALTEAMVATGGRTGGDPLPAPSGSGGAVSAPGAGGALVMGGGGGAASLPQMPVDAGAARDVAAVPQARDSAPASDGLIASGKIWQVTTENWKYLPLNLTIKVGDIIEWIPKPGMDPGLHKPTSAKKDAKGFSPDGQWMSPDAIGPGHLKSWRHQFAEAGTFYYMCTNNASHLGQGGEHATVVVEAP